MQITEADHAALVVYINQSLGYIIGCKIRSLREVREQLLEASTLLEKVRVANTPAPDKIAAINLAILDLEGMEANDVCDGYHTFGELYEHRVLLFIALCHQLPTAIAWKSRLNSDGSAWDGWFIAGINFKPGEQISYHLPANKWDLLKVQELSEAPEFDGHTPEDVTRRLKKLIQASQAQPPKGE